MANGMLKDVAGEARKSSAIKKILAIIGIILVVVIIWKAYQWAKKGTDAVGTIVSRPIIESQTGVSAARQLVCEQVAAECRSAVGYLGGWISGGLNFITYVFDSELTNALNKLLTREEAAYTSAHYKTLASGRSLLAVVKSSEYRDADSIKPEIRLNLS